MQSSFVSLRAIGWVNLTTSLTTPRAKLLHYITSQPLLCDKGKNDYSFTYIHTGLPGLYLALLNEEHSFCMRDNLLIVMFIFLGNSQASQQMQMLHSSQPSFIIPAQGL